MPLPKPVLDTRTFDQLVAEGRGLIPRLAPQWTDHNASDPGITLLELAAWLAEQNFYRFDRVPAEAQRAFLRLVGVTPQPPAVAQTIVSVGNTLAVPVILPARMQLAGAVGDALFETTEALVASSAALVQVLAGKSVLADCTVENATPHDPARIAVGSFLPFGRRPHRGAALYLGFDRPPGNAGDEVSLYVWTTDPARDAATRAALIEEWEAQRAHAEQSCPPGTLDHLPDWRQHYWARTVWEYYRGPNQWAPLELIADETRALTLSGFVRFKAPADIVVGGPGPHFFIRCRLSGGRFECPTRLDYIATNAVRAEHALTIEPETQATSRGRAAERYRAIHSPIVAGSTALTLVEGSVADTDWREVLDWDRSGAHDKHYRLEPENAVIQFGNGLRGVPATAGAQVVLGYRMGGGVAGNVRARTLVRFDLGSHNQSLVPGWSAVAPGLSVMQPIAADGGAPAEPLPSAQARAVESLALPYKAVTPGDFEALALRTPGVAVGRAKALIDLHPVVPCYRAAGSTTVVVVPNCTGPHPLPSRSFLRAVKAYLHPRRLVTSEVHVIAPHYVRVTVHATLHAELGVDTVTLARTAGDALDAFFNPLTGGNGRGWTIGRAVYRTEVMALLAGLPGVLRVTDLGLRAKGDAEPRCGNLEICAHDLITPGRHRIQIQAARVADRLTRSEAHECECP